MVLTKCPLIVCLSAYRSVFSQYYLATIRFFPSPYLSVAIATIPLLHHNMQTSREIEENFVSYYDIVSVFAHCDLPWPTCSKGGETPPAYMLANKHCYEMMIGRYHKQ